MSDTTSIDSLKLTHSYAEFPDSQFHAVRPTPLPDPKLISLNNKVAEQLGGIQDWMSESALTAIISGHQLPETANPLAMKYAGHQFGQFNPQLGDGRGILIGELDVDGQLWDMHIKGAGLTRYSRMGDGRAVLRSSIREYLVGEALTHLNIPSTRALGIVVSSEKVRREMVEPAAAILRTTQCHIRFGHFEHLFYSGQHEPLKHLADYCIQRYFPEYQQADNPYLAMFDEVSRRSAAMVAGWQAYGFLHGVMNTDNMSLIGETFDHGPYAFIDTWREKAVYNHTDELGRYAFNKQPDIVHWNLSALAQALTPLVEVDDLKASLEKFPEWYNPTYRQRMAERLGLATEQADDALLIKQWRSLLNQYELDHHRLYRALSHAQTTDEAGNASLDQSELIPWLEPLKTWLPDYQARLQQEIRTPEQRKQQMLSVNPAFVLRTHVASHIIEEAEQGNYAPLNDWLAILQNPYEDQPKWNDWKHAPDNKGLVMLSCSS
ncbi:MAG: protein adenylyltransferase SelO [Oceanobacter sp.]